MAEGCKGADFVIYQGRELDVLSLWDELVELPSNIGDPLPMFLDKTQCPNPDHQTHKRHFQINTSKPFVTASRAAESADHTSMQ
jgi:hypothetical protein